MMVQKNSMFYQRGEVVGWKLPLVHIIFEFHTGVLKLKFCESGKAELFDVDKHEVCRQNGRF